MKDEQKTNTHKPEDAAEFELSELTGYLLIGEKDGKKLLQSPPEGSEGDGYSKAVAESMAESMQEIHPHVKWRTERQYLFSDNIDVWGGEPS